MKVEMHLRGVEGILKTLQSLPSEVVSKRGGPVRLALAKGARVLRNEAKRNLRRAIDAPGASGITESTGFTENNVFMKRKLPMSGEKGERFIVSVKYNKHPTGGLRVRSTRASKGSDRKSRRRAAQEIRANDIAFMMEYGTSKQQATPWLRPAFQAKAAEAIRVANEDLIRRVEKIVAQLAMKNRR